jgi:hypothetical protein
MRPVSRYALVGTTVAALATATATVILAGQPASAEELTQRGPGVVVHELRHDVSPALAGLTPVPPGGEMEGAPIRQMPNRGGGSQTDPVVQRAVPRLAPSLGRSFDGLGQGMRGPAGTFTVRAVPPDTNAAVGPTQIVEVVNTAFAVFNKAGTAVFGPAATSTLFAGFGGPCQTTNDGDGVVRYDALANRWIITQFANAFTNNGPFFECVAVSRTADATGSYNRYAFQFANFPDYPKLSVWPDAYYITYNLFRGNSFVGADACAMNRAAMLAGATATQQCHTTSAAIGSLLAADFEGGTPPPTGASNTLLALGTSSTTLVFFKSHVDFANPGRSTFTGPRNLTVARFTPACGASGTCIPQNGVAQRLDSLSDRIMFRLAYRNVGGHESLVTNHAVTVGSSVGVRWYELRQVGNGNPSVFQQGTFAPDATFRWMGSIAMDRAGNIGLGYSASSTAIHPQIRVTGRRASDPAGQMTQAEGTIVAGGGSQNRLSRWGDYSSMQVDPADGCTFWYAQEYLATTGNRNWRTRIGSFTLPGCAAAA